MPKRNRISAQEASTAIQDYLEKHPEIGGLKGLSERVDVSYDSLQKYAKGSNAPPIEKWERLCEVIGVSRVERPSIKPGLFYSTMENQTMSPETSVSSNHPSTIEPRSAETLSEDAKQTADNDADYSDAENNEDIQYLSDLMTDKRGWSSAEDRQEIFLPVHGFTWFYPEEMRIIDHPAFQRLAGMHQLGMTHLVYRGATHRRIEHALGAVGVAQRMLEAVTHNCLKRNPVTVDAKDQWILGHPPTATERRFVRLAALLHDIGHVPFGHTIEDELRLLNKHDGEQRVERLFNNDTWHGVKTPTLAELINRFYEPFMPEGLQKRLSPSQLLKRIILKPPRKQSDEEKKDDQAIEKLCAGAGFRIRICRDVVGDTICADLLDYLHRDWYHLGKPRYFDERILHYMEIRTPQSNKAISVNKRPNPTAEDVFVICIGNRPKLRTDGISAILSLLESRYELAEAVLFHRTKMNATAMLERALSFAIPQSVIAEMSLDSEKLGPGQGKAKSGTKEGGKDKVKPDLERWLIENPEEVLLPALLRGDGPVNQSDLPTAARVDWEYGGSLVSRLLRRDLYDSLLMVTYDEFESCDVDLIQKKYGDDEDAATNRAKALRLLEKDFALPPGSIVMYCPESRMNSKIAEVQLFVEHVVSPFDEYEEAHKDALSAGHLKAQLDRFKSLWKIGFFIDQKVRETHGEGFLSELKYAIRSLVLNLYPRGESVETESARIARSVVSIPTFHLYGATALSSPRVLQSARTDSSVVTDVYPTGARTLLDFVEKNESSGSSGNAGKGAPRA